MGVESKVDCVVIGYHDLDFQEYANSQKRLASTSGAYRDAKHNSVLVDGKRVTYMDLINRGVADASGKDPGLSVFEVPSLGVTYLVSFLRRRGFTAEMVGFFNYEKPKLAALLAENPRTVAITTTYYVDPAPVLGVVRFVRQHCPETRIVVGGPHIFNLVSFSDHHVQDYMFRHMGADIYVCDSQGEGALAGVLAALKGGRPEDLTRVPNLAIASGKSFQRTERKVENNDLNGDVVDFKVFRDDENVFDYPVFLRTARSCPFVCSFCNFPALAGKHVVTELDTIERQMDYLHEKGVRDLIFVDDTFNVPLPRFKNLLRMMIRKGYDFNWISFFRCSNSDDTAFDLMAESGCKQVFLGIESGDQTILNNMRKYANVEKYRTGIQKLNERGIVTYASIIAGFPGETEQTIRNTFRFIEESGPTFFNIQLYYHDIRAPIHQDAEKYGIQGAGYSWKHDTMEWSEAADWADYGFSSIQNSVPTTLYNFSIWALPYLLSRGLEIGQIREFAGVARNMLVKSFDDDETVQFPEESRRLASIFRQGAPVGGSLAATG